MKPNRVEVDISSARTNQAGEISGIVIRGKAREETVERRISSDARGIHQGLLADSDVPISEHREIEVSEAFAEAACDAVGFNLEGRTLEELNSTAKVRVFLPVGRKTTYMEG